METLRSRWHAVLGRLSPGADRRRVAALGDDLIDRWLESHRAYHDAVHLAEVLAALDELHEGGALPPSSADRADLFAWFHDAVYDVAAPAGESEEASARMVETTLPPLGLDPADVADVARLVRESATHEPTGPGSDPLGDAVHDADLWILSAPPERFEAYCHQVRLEFGHVRAADFARGRTEVLAPFARRDRLYRTDHAHAHWTGRARANLATEIDRLSGAAPR